MKQVNNAFVRKESYVSNQSEVIRDTHGDTHARLHDLLSLTMNRPIEQPKNSVNGHGLSVANWGFK